MVQHAYPSRKIYEIISLHLSGGKTKRVCECAATKFRLFENHFKQSHFKLKIQMRHF